MGGGKGAGGTGTEAPPALSTCSLLDNSIPNFCVRTRDTTKVSYAHRFCMEQRGRWALLPLPRTTPAGGQSPPGSPALRLNGRVEWGEIRRSSAEAQLPLPCPRPLRRAVHLRGWGRGEGGFARLLGSV